MLLTLLRFLHQQSNNKINNTATCFGRVQAISRIHIKTDAKNCSPVNFFFYENSIVTIESGVT